MLPTSAGKLLRAIGHRRLFDRLLNRNNCRYQIFCGCDARAVALSGAIFHQYHITRAEGAFFPIARAYFKVSLQAKKELMLRWTNILADPASRRPHELQRSGLKSMGNM